MIAPAGTLAFPRQCSSTIEAAFIRSDISPTTVGSFRPMRAPGSMALRGRSKAGAAQRAATGGAVCACIFWWCCCLGPAERQYRRVCGAVPDRLSAGPVRMVVRSAGQASAQDKNPHRMSVSPSITTKVAIYKNQRIERALRSSVIGAPWFAAPFKSMAI